MKPLTEGKLLGGTGSVKKPNSTQKPIAPPPSPTPKFKATKKEVVASLNKMRSVLMRHGDLVGAYLCQSQMKKYD